MFNPLQVRSPLMNRIRKERLRSEISCRCWIIFVASVLIAYWFLQVEIWRFLADIYRVI